MIKSSNKNFKKTIFNCRLCSCRSWSVGCCSAAIPSSPSTAPASATLTGTLSLVIKWTSWRRQLAYTLWFPPCRRRTALGCLLSRRPGTCIYSWKFYIQLSAHVAEIVFPRFFSPNREESEEVRGNVVFPALYSQHVFSSSKKNRILSLYKASCLVKHFAIENCTHVRWNGVYCSSLKYSVGC